MQFTTILSLIGINAFLGLIFFFILKRNYFLIIPYLIAWGAIFYIFPNIESVLYFGLPHIFLSIIIHLITKSKDLSKLESPFNMVIKTTKGDKLINDIDRGTQIFGSSGAGKTASVIAPYIKHYKKWNFAGILYDYKNGELTELLLGEYGNENVRIVAPHDPTISDRCNFLDPNILTDEIKIQEIVKVILMNLTPNAKQTDFFTENAEALLCGVILAFKLYHPNLCTFPHICAFLTTTDFSGIRKFPVLNEKTNEIEEREEFNAYKKLEDFLTKDTRVQIQASAFLKGISSEKLAGSVLSTLLNALRKFSNPRFFWVFSHSDFKLNINDKNNRLVVSVLNDPSIPLSVSPFVAGTIQAILGEMSVRGQDPAFLALDEGATLKLLNMSAIPATMRSFKIATLYATQDISQGNSQFGVHEFKSILSNLSIQFFGSTNDPDTAQFYEKYIDIIEKDRISESKDAGFIGGVRSINVSKQELKKIRSTEFFTLSRGEFVCIVNGQSEKIQFPMPKNLKSSMQKKISISEKQVETNFYNIINSVKGLADSL